MIFPVLVTQTTFFFALGGAKHTAEDNVDADLLLFVVADAAAADFFNDADKEDLFFEDLDTDFTRNCDSGNGGKWVAAVEEEVSPGSAGREQKDFFAPLLSNELFFAVFHEFLLFSPFLGEGGDGRANPDADGDFYIKIKKKKVDML